MLISFPPAYTLYIYAYFSLLKNIINFIHTGLAFRRKKNINRMRDVAYNYHGHLMSRECILLKKIAYFVSISNGEKIESAIRKKNSGCITIEKKCQIKCLGILLVLRNKTKIGKLTWNSFFGITGIRRTSL